MKPKSSLLSRLALVLLILGIVLLYAYRVELVKAPRVRVGPLSLHVDAGAKLRIFALGDTGTGEEAQRRVASAMESRCLSQGADAIFLLGDNAYQSGVESVEDPAWQSKVLGPYSTPCLERLKVYPVLGNHDYKGNPAAQIEYSLVNKRWHMPNRFYSVDFGSLLKLVAYDSQVSEFCFKPTFCSVDFLLEEVKKRETQWTIVVGHHPLASSSDHGVTHTGGLRGVLLKPRLCNEADLYLAGHAHHLEHLKSPECVLETFVSGAGGADLYAIGDRHEESTFAKSAYGFLELEIGEAELVARFIGEDATILYETTKKPRVR